MKLKDIPLRDQFVKYNNYMSLVSLYRSKAIDEADIEQLDITHIFLRELDMAVRKQETISININAVTRGFKSTTGFAICYMIHNLMVKYGYKKRSDKFGVKNICMDQSDFMFKMNDPKTEFDVFLIDEDNAMNRTGQDSTVLEALNQDFSNVDADRYVYRVSCSPGTAGDINAKIHIDIIHGDTDKYCNYGKVYYIQMEGGDKTVTLLGTVKIDVYPIIKNWVKGVKDKFYTYNQLNKEYLIQKSKPNPNKKLIATIRRKLTQIDKYLTEWEKKDEYIKYYRKKRFKIELRSKYNIRRPRDMAYAPIIKEIITLLKPMTKYSYLLNKDMLKNNVRRYMEKKMPQSILGLQITTERVSGELSMYAGYYKLDKDYEVNKAKLIKENKAKQIPELKKEFDNLKRTQLQLINESEAELDRMIECEQEYNGRYGK